MMSQMITACLVVYNEERVIQRCLDSLKGVVDEIIVVHDGDCTDQTLDICRNYTEKVFVRSRIGVADPHRPFCFEQATGDWILHLDADEMLSPELRACLRDLVEDSHVDLYAFLWPYTDGKRVIRNIEHPYRRCLARRTKMYFYGMPEEVIQTYGAIKYVPLVIEHRPLYDNYTWRLLHDKGLPWTKLLAQWVWKGPDEIPCYGVKDKRELVQHLEDYRRNPLLKALVEFPLHISRQLYRGLWKAGWLGLRIVFLSAVFRVSIFYYVFKCRPRNARKD